MFARRPFPKPQGADSKANMIRALTRQKPTSMEAAAAEEAAAGNFILLSREQCREGAAAVTVQFSRENAQAVATRRAHLEALYKKNHGQMRAEIEKRVLATV